MSNTIRTPRQGMTANSRRIAEAVDNEEWQKFRLSLKGLPTQDKLNKLQHYFTHEHGDHFRSYFFDFTIHMEGWMNCDYCIRVDNYLKALCRGGQLYPGESLETALKNEWQLNIKK